MSKLYSYQIGKTALSLLTPGACGQVLAAFSKAAYLITEQAELFWLASEDTPMHLRGMRIAGAFPQLAAGEKFFIEGRCIRIASDFKVDFGDAFTWTVSGVPADTALEIEKIPLRVKRLFLSSFDLSQASGFGRLIPKILSLALGQPGEETEIDPVLALGWNGIHKIAKACLTGNMSGLLKEADALVGLGEGLTPSGDDFLGGLLFCVHCLERIYPGFIYLDSSEQASFIESARKRTHLISFTLLKDLINGQAFEPLYELIHLILSDQPPVSFRPVSCLTQIGHSSGWDLLAGALTGLLLTFGGHDTIDSSAVSHTRSICA
jgi:hypothetical protein